VPDKRHRATCSRHLSWLRAPLNRDKPDCYRVHSSQVVDRRADEVRDAGGFVTDGAEPWRHARKVPGSCAIIPQAAAHTRAKQSSASARVLATDLAAVSWNNSPPEMNGLLPSSAGLRGRRAWLTQSADRYGQIPTTSATRGNKPPASNLLCWVWRKVEVAADGPSRPGARGRWVADVRQEGGPRLAPYAIQVGAGPGYCEKLRRIASIDTGIEAGLSR
jgi:hypothetical protein